MIRFEDIEGNSASLRAAFKEAKPFSYVCIDGFCDPQTLVELEQAIPDPRDGSINKSRDYVFAKNKFEKSGFRNLGASFAELYDDFMSDRFRALLSTITNETLFVDPDFHGGGIHQGGEGSFLDMHADFNVHPKHATWFRNLNILLYLNVDWRPEHKGQLRLRNKVSQDEVEVAPLFNRCVIMHTRDYTLHGYDRINFPEGKYRRSVAAYAYSEMTETVVSARSTTWYPDESNVKRALGRAWPALVAVKHRLFGSATERNR